MPAKPQSFATTSAFEVLGPVMVGPSSSHTAGALRCAQVAASLLEGRITSVRFTLWNSFAHTYRGHGTDRALVGGILGFDTDDERIRDAFAVADERGLTCTFASVAMTPPYTPIPLISTLKTRRAPRRRCAARAWAADGCASAPSTAYRSRSGLYTTLFVAHRDAPGALAALTGALAEAEMNIAFCRTYRTEAAGQAYSCSRRTARPAPRCYQPCRRSTW